MAELSCKYLIFEEKYVFMELHNALEMYSKESKGEEEYWVMTF